ncbi:MAG TPA: Nramp family divalent metal transporter [Methylophilaceae bacterium]|nr:Nramp family divalent metal transporter [Methylophilaceae bacterium]
MTPPDTTATADAARGADGPGPSAPHYASRSQGSWFRKLLGFMGPGYLVAVGYMDPGNWATDLAAGSGFGYSLLWIILLSNAMAIVLQILTVKLGVVTGMDLAQACRANYSRRSSLLQWVLCELAICACDLAEVIGSAIAINLLFGIPLMVGVALTILDVFLMFWLQRRGYRYLEAMIMALLAVIFACFAITIVLAQPQWAEVAAGFVPSAQTVTNPLMLYLAIGIIGATVMPHNLYLHSSIVQNRPFERSTAGKREAIRFASADIVIALLVAFLVNAAILVTSSAVFNHSGHTEVAEIQEAYHLLTPLLGTGLASFLFALALLASGQSSTLTATLAGQIVMEGYLNLRLPFWLRRFLTRAIAIVPALLVTAWYGESGVARLLVFTQVVLSMQLPFAVIPLIRFTSRRSTMGEFANGRWLVAAASLVAALIIALNTAMLYSFIRH